MVPSSFQRWKDLDVSQKLVAHITTIRYIRTRDWGRPGTGPLIRSDNAAVHQRSWTVGTPRKNGLDEGMLFLTQMLLRGGR